MKSRDYWAAVRLVPVLLEVFLLIVLGPVERPKWRDLGHDGRIPDSCGREPVGPMGATPLQARIGANLTAALRGREPSLLVLAVIFAVVFWVSLRHASAKPWAVPGIVVSLLFLALITLAWLWDRHFARPTVPVNALVRVPGGEVTVKTEAEPSHVAEVLAAFRDTAQNIRVLPSPQGRVVGEPSDQSHAPKV